MRVRGFLPKGKGFLNKTAAPLFRGAEVLGSCFMFHLDYGQKLLLGDTIRKDKLFCTRISRSFSGVVVCAWLLFSGLPGAGMEWTSWMRVSSMRWRPRLMGLSMCLVQGPCPPTESHGEKATPTLLYTTFVLLSKVAESWALGYCFVFEAFGNLGSF